MDIYFAGCEQPVYFNLLHDLGVRHIAISFYEWRKRYTVDDLYRHLPNDVRVCVTAGVARKEGLDFHAFAADYVEFCERHADRALIYDLDAPACPEGVRREVQRELMGFPNVVLFPIDPTVEELRQLASIHERLGVNARVAKSADINDLRRLPATLYGSNITDPRKLKDAKFAATTSLAWLGGRRFGELWVFARGKLRHFPADQVGRGVRLHAEDIEAYGVDPMACMAGSKEALTTLAVRSLRAMELSLSGRPRDRQGGQISRITPPEAVDDGSTPQEPNPALPSALLVARNVVNRESGLLPLLQQNPQVDGQNFTLTPTSLRQCDNCYLSSACPKFEAAHSCAYAIPVQIRTDEDWQQASHVLLEMQFQRVMFGRYAEELDGGTLNARVGQEMDRFYKLLNSHKDLKQGPAPTGTGILSALLSEVMGNTPAPPALERRASDGPIEESQDNPDETFVIEVEEAPEEADAEGT